MANSYTQFSEILVLKNKKELAWIRIYMEAAEIDVGHGDHWDDDYTPLSEAAKFWDPVLRESDSENAEFEWSVDGKELWLHIDAEGNIEHAAKLVQEFFKKMRPEGDDIFTLTWSGTCSAPRAGEFGGGACVVTRKKIYWMNTWDWVSAQVKKLGTKR